MNKNWLYRILAIALVAMLALPMFAMAEETAIELGADGEATAAEQKLGVDWDYNVDSYDIDATTIDDGLLPLSFLGNDSYTLNVDMAEDLLDYQVTDVVGDVATAMDSVKCTKNTKKAVLTCDKHNHITIKKTGKAVLTFKTVSASSGDKVTVKLTVNVKDSSKFKVVKEDDDNSAIGKVWKIALGANFTTNRTWTPGDAPASNVIAESAQMGDSTKLALRAIVTVDGVDYQVDQDDDGSAVDPGTAVTADDAEQIGNAYRVATYKSSNKGVVQVNPITGALLAKKVGSATVTATLYDINPFNGNAYAMKKVKVKIKVIKNKTDVNKNMKLALAAAKADDAIYPGIKQAEYTKITVDENGEVVNAKLKITFFVANGWPTSLKRVWDPTVTVSYIKFNNRPANSFGAPAGIYNDADYAQILVDNNTFKDGKFAVNWKAGKISTFTHTFDVDTVVDLTNPKSTLALTLFQYELTDGGDLYTWKAAE